MKIELPFFKPEPKTSFDRAVEGHIGSAPKKKIASSEIPTKKKPKEKVSEKSTISRRAFLKTAGIGLAAVATGYKVGETSRKIAEKAGWVEDADAEKEIVESPKEILENKAKEVESVEDELTPEELGEVELGEIKLSDADLEMMNSIFHPDVNKKFEVNLELAGVITKYWINKYQNQEKPVLDRAKIEMGKIEKSLKEQFLKNGVPEEFRFLAIPESGWRKVKSRAGAEGYYQFMPKTAEMYGLQDPNNPIESANACARLLKDLHSKSGDWDLALAGYNGGFFWKYIIRCVKDETKPTYPGFLQMIEERANNERVKILESKGFPHIIKKRKNGAVESLWHLSKKFGVSVAEIKKANPVSEVPLESRIYEGIKIRIPFTEKQKQKKFKEKIAGLIENIQYPPKFNAVIEALKIRPAQYVSGRKLPEDMARSI